MADKIEKMIAETFLQMAEGLETGSFGKKPKIAITGMGSEHGEENSMAGAIAAARDGIDVYYIGTLEAEGVTTVKVADVRMVTGNGSAVAEGGHMCIAYGGELCGCGKRGCYEAYASVSALIRQTERAMEAHPESLMHKIAKEEGVNGKTAFIAMKRGDKVAKEVVDTYIGYVGAGMVNFANIFWPEVFIVGGAISREGDTLILPLREYIAANIHSAAYNPPIEVVAATLGGDAGIVGAAALVMER